MGKRSNLTIPQIRELKKEVEGRDQVTPELPSLITKARSPRRRLSPAWPSC